MKGSTSVLAHHQSSAARTVDLERRISYSVHASNGKPWFLIKAVNVLHGIAQMFDVGRSPVCGRHEQRHPASAVFEAIEDWLFLDVDRNLIGEQLIGRLRHVGSVGAIAERFYDQWQRPFLTRL